VLHFYKLPDKQSTSNIVAERLKKELSAKKQVLWLVSGGSNIEIETAAMAAIPANLQPNLTVMLSDERYGPYGHKDSNLQQLQDAGFNAGRAKVIPVIVPESLPMGATASHYEDNVRTIFAEADTIIAQLGIGDDGHIAGILPNSEATTATDLVANYSAELYDRITLTFNALKKVNAVYVFAFGEDKRPQLERLRDTEVPLAEQPAQFLKQIPEVYVYNDQIDMADANNNGGNQ
jgi:6-phosphogluconolactonase/glucosamine-6-phosphate isomerase/deaminase